MADKFQLKALITGVDKLSPMLAGARKNVAAFRKGLEKTGLGKIGFGDIVTGGVLAAPFVAGAKAAIDFESQMADVRKVVNFDTPQQFKQMGDDIGRMSDRLPMAAGDIAKIVAAGGQAGFAREELLGFAEAAVKMGVAFDQTAEQSGEMMSTWRTAFRMTQEGAIRLADQINYLGNTGPASAQKVSGIVTEVGALGEVAGLSAAQVAALGATMAGVGVKQDVAATGIKNFMLSLTKGTAATKSQSLAFKSLRLDSKNVAEGMQKDAQKTLLDVLTRISMVDAAKRPALLTELFGSESVAAITPLLTNVELLRTNLLKVGDATKYAGSMEKEYQSRAATTANNLQLLRNTVDGVARALGNALLPGINSVLDAMRPMITQVAELVQANPQLVKGLAVAGIAFTALRAGVFAATVAVRVLGVAFAATPIGIIAVAIAAAAGLIVANWETVGPFFTALWDLIKAYTTPFIDFMKSVFGWTPMALIIKNWTPITEFFRKLWEDIQPYIQPILRLFGMEDGGVGLTAKVQQQAEAQRIRNAGEGGGTGAFLLADAPQTMRRQQVQRNASQAGLDPNQLLRVPGLPAPGSLLQQTAAANKTQLNGELVMRFQNAPPGLRVDPAKTSQPGLSITPKVGYRSLSGDAP
ncbi:phage tail tape measure protein [Pseudomonas sp. OVF7]|uniref:phage tail tape measure protein n=2 Tax=Gammaproteobacteria TaxID=1236 RepID=UPI00103C236D|nr:MULTISPECIES: phage tail tape measure protein [Pseudomonas]MDR6581610.1 TP901 family phage tail tape measure protein [Pseudomonas extremaustralis]WLD68658.1 phage tail tape measure protein [Pseudomonas sp. OVF7]WLI52887.1 phage tail tape measure protein [Pseudomonas sp. FP833]